MKKIQLTRGEVALVDDEDFEKLSQFKWHIDSKRYATRWQKKNRKCIRTVMHRFILGLGIDDKVQVDHINGNGFDNRRCNLRVCTSSQNQWNAGRRVDNTSGYKGVSWLKERQKWRAQIQSKGKKMHLGLFEDRESAAITYNENASRLFGEFARLNKLHSEYPGHESYRGGSDD